MTFNTRSAITAFIIVALTIISSTAAAEHLRGRALSDPVHTLPVLALTCDPEKRARHLQKVSTTDHFHGSFPWQTKFPFNKVRNSNYSPVSSATLACDGSTTLKYHRNDDAAFDAYMQANFRAQASPYTCTGNWARWCGHGTLTEIPTHCPVMCGVDAGEENLLRRCEAACNACDGCIAFVNDKNMQTCTFKSAPYEPSRFFFDTRYETYLANWIEDRDAAFAPFDADAPFVPQAAALAAAADAGPACAWTVHEATEVERRFARTGLETLTDDFFRGLGDYTKDDVIAHCEAACATNALCEGFVLRSGGCAFYTHGALQKGSSHSAPAATWNAHCDGWGFGLNFHSSGEVICHADGRVCDGMCGATEDLTECRADCEKRSATPEYHVASAGCTRDTLEKWTNAAFFAARDTCAKRGQYLCSSEALHPCEGGDAPASMRVAGSDSAFAAVGDSRAPDRSWAYVGGEAKATGPELSAYGGQCEFRKLAATWIAHDEAMSELPLIYRNNFHSAAGYQTAAEFETACARVCIQDSRCGGFVVYPETVSASSFVANTPSYCRFVQAGNKAAQSLRIYEAAREADPSSVEGTSPPTSECAGCTYFYKPAGCGARSAPCLHGACRAGYTRLAQHRISSGDDLVTVTHPTLGWEIHMLDVESYVDEDAYLAACAEWCDKAPGGICGGFEDVYTNQHGEPDRRCYFFSRTATTVPTGMVRAVNKGGDAHTRYVLQLGEGDCDRDDQCAEGLSCMQRSSGESVEGVYIPDGFPAHYDICAPLVTAVNLGRDPSGKLQLGQGDCDAGDCDETQGLECVQRTHGETVEGVFIKNSFPAHYDICGKRGFGPTQQPVDVYVANTVQRPETLGYAEEDLELTFACCGTQSPFAARPKMPKLTLVQVEGEPLANGATEAYVTTEFMLEAAADAGCSVNAEEGYTCEASASLALSASIRAAATGETTLGGVAVAGTVYYEVTAEVYAETGAVCGPTSGCAAEAKVGAAVAVTVGVEATGALDTGMGEVSGAAFGTVGTNAGAEAAASLSLTISEVSFGAGATYSAGVTASAGIEVGGGPVTLGAEIGACSGCVGAAFSPSFGVSGCDVSVGAEGTAAIGAGATVTASGSFDACETAKLVGEALEAAGEEVADWGLDLSKDIAAGVMKDVNAIAALADDVGDLVASEVTAIVDDVGEGVLGVVGEAGEFFENVGEAVEELAASVAVAYFSGLKTAFKALKKLF